MGDMGIGARFKIGLLDIVAAGVVLVVVLLPAPSKKVHRFYEGKAAVIAPEIGAAQADLVRAPHDRLALDRLVGALTDAGQSDFALRVAGEKASEQLPDRWRPTLMVSVVHAERLEVKEASEWAEKALVACEEPGSTCKPHEKFRLELYADALAAGVESGIDPREDPKGFARQMQKATPVIRVGAPR